MALATILTTKLNFVEVVQTSSLEESIEELAARDDVSLALFDLTILGIESLASLRTVRDRFKNPRVGVVSASKSRGDVISALEAGVHGYVPKALGISGFTQALKLIVDGGIYVPPMVANLPPLVQEKPGAPNDARPSSTARLTKRQHSILALLVQGKSNKAIARDLDIGEGTVKVHIAGLCRSLGVRTRTAAAVKGGPLLQSDSRGLATEISQLRTTTLPQV
jgi:DNA-binding NarL/FixJ family response regulator